MGVIFPRLVVDSSPGAFHLLYISKAHTHFWTSDRRTAVAMQVAGVTPGVYTPGALAARLKAGGVDYSYMKQTIAMSKFRLPGSLNVKKCLDKSDTSLFVENVIAYGWLNENYALTDKQQTEILDSYSPFGVKARLKGIPPNFWVRLAAQIKPGLSEIFDKKMADKLAEFIAKNKKMLKLNECRISQTYMAEALGVTQVTASRLIKRLIEEKYLIIVKDYVIKERSKTYGAGEVLAASIDKISRKRKINYDFTKPYVDGATNAHYMKDVHAAIRAGMSIDEITKIVESKQAHKPNKKKRTTREIATFYLSCLNRRKAAQGSTRSGHDKV